MLEFGLTSQEFKDQYLERQCYLHKAALAERPIQWSDIDQLLPIAETDNAALQLFQNGQVPPNIYTEERIEFGRWVRRLNKNRFYSLLRDGATMVINRIENYSLAAKRLSTEVSRFTGQQTTSNAYASFSGDGSFGKHWDTHDVVVIQLIGKKRWQVFAPTFPLPLSHHTSEHEQLRQECPLTPVLDRVLETGDLLYIPRGWWHNVIPFAKGSLHFSVGVYVPTVNDYLMWICSRHLSQQVKARAGLIDASNAAYDLPELLQFLSKTALEKDNMDSFRNDLQARDRLSSEFNMQLFISGGITSLQDNNRLMLTAYGLLKGHHSEVRFNGGRMRLESVGRAIVNALSSTTVLSVAALCAQLPSISRHDVLQAILELATHEVITIEPRSEGN